MYTIIYVCAIVLAVVGIVLFFFLRRKKDKKHLDNYKKSRQDQIGEVIKNEQTQLAIQEKIKKEPENKNKVKVEFEDFSLDGKPVEKQSNNKTFQNGDLEEEFIPFKSENEIDDIDESDEEFFDQKFAEYEKFLKENLDSEDDVDDEENYYEEEDNNNELDALINFDYSSLNGKSDEEIAEIIKLLPPKAQEILINDILGKKDFDNKED